MVVVRVVVVVRVDGGCEGCGDCETHVVLLFMDPRVHFDDEESLIFISTFLI